LIDLIMITITLFIWIYAQWRSMIVNNRPVRMIRVDARDVECDDCWNEQLWEGVKGHAH